MAGGEGYISSVAFALSPVGGLGAALAVSMVLPSFGNACVPWTLRHCGALAVVF